MGVSFENVYLKQRIFCILVDTSKYQNVAADSQHHESTKMGPVRASFLVSFALGLLAILLILWMKFKRCISGYSSCNNRVINNFELINIVT